MPIVPENTCTQADLEEWYRTQAELTLLKQKEILLRCKLFKFHFPTPKEGVNNKELNDGTGCVLKGTHKINRAVDDGALSVMSPKLLEVQVPVDVLFVRKPELCISEYRKLNVDQVKLVDQCLIIKNGTPELKIVLPAKAKS
jgi:hypothetical protein